MLSSACVLLVSLATVNAADTVTARPIASTRQLAAAIDAQIGQPRYSASSWGIAVVSLDTGRTLYAHDADRLLQPASTAKLYTAALVLDTLGTDYRIPTQLLVTRPIQRGQVGGPLILYGMGDPTLGTPDTHSDWADELATQLAAAGVREVHGDLIADDSYFSGPAMGSGWEARDLQSWFAVPSCALSVQENVVNLTVTPSNQAGGSVSLTFDSPESMPHVVNTMTTGAPHTRSDINLYRAPGDATLYAFGSMPAGAQPQTFRLAMADPAWFAGTLLRDALTRHGIRIDGRLRVQHWPQPDDINLDRATVVAQVLSPPLMDVLTRGLKRSQNLYLQNLLQIAGVKAQAEAQQAGDPDEGFLSSEAWAIRAMRQWLDRIGIAPDAAQIEEGAGLSREDLVTPQATVQLLTYLSSQPYGTQLRDALPSAGVDGTLEFRMRGSAAADNVQAKTGSMTYVHCLAGYVTTSAGERLAFALMVNNYVRQGDDPSASRDLDAIAEMLAAFQGHS
ncbi:D-alanyl-D-alanine carboxypeptidase/D-alanyl-D-alanine endopeptidase [Dyella sp.]|uniref:D-alanyl-D-alanine carboxypeptidase/D-alanyl-D-alanine endopeptidase n=1 Tax=Dyella sp. TaxID=1869338 RepID=UPI002D7F8393|nr:D-alanyl-D-alanine carboxypeptidase/D-alanyl-D-alanine-endopeptidase [Dyella sp.]